MSEEQGSIRSTDIVFDCPHCGKSHAIDYRGAGLTIACVDCGNDVEVPIPEGMDIDDFDRSAEEQELRVVMLRKALTAAEARIAVLERELQALERDLQTLAAANARMKAHLDQKPVERVQLALADLDRIATAQGAIVTGAGNISVAVDRMREHLTPDTQAPTIDEE